MKLTFVFVCLCFCFVWSSDEIQKLRVESHALQKDLSTFCSDSVVPKMDQRMLGHGDVMLPILSYHLMVPIRATSYKQSASLLLRDWIQSNQELSVEESTGNIFHYSHFNEQYHGDWEIEPLPVQASGLPVFKLTSKSNNEQYFAKFYPYPQATDAFHADLFAIYCLENLPQPKFGSFASSLMIRKFILPESGEVIYGVLSKKIDGESLKDILLSVYNDPTNDELIERLKKSIFLSARAIGELHAISNDKNPSAKSEMYLLSEHSMSELMHLKLGKSLPIEIVDEIGKRLDSLYNGVKGLQNTKSIIPSNGCFLHFDLSSNNLFIDETSQRVTLFDSPIMYRSFGFSNFNIKCDSETFLANPIVPMSGIGHPALDYYFFTMYINLESHDLISNEILTDLDSLIQEGYCNGWYSDNSEKLNSCIEAENLWGIEIETFYHQYFMYILAPSKVIDVIQTAIEMSQQ